MYTLYIANKNYSSWSLRPWLLLRQADIPFSERMVPFHDAADWQAFRAISPNGKVPCLVNGDTTVWESLAIMEYLAERHPGVWPQEARARAWARSAAAEMHAGFTTLRSNCPMSCAVRVRLHAQSDALQRDVSRISALWADGLTRFGGPYLAGRSFCAVDAFFAPVAFRIQSYGLSVDAPTLAYVRRLLDLPAMQDWYAAALQEPWRDAPHEAEVGQLGTVLQDLRTHNN